MHSVVRKQWLLLLHVEPAVDDDGGSTAPAVDDDGNCAQSSV